MGVGSMGSEVLRLEYVDGVMHFKTADEDAVELVEGDEYCSAADLEQLRARIAELEQANSTLRADRDRIEKAVFYAAKSIDEFRAMSARDLLRDILQKAVARGGK